MDAQTKIQFKAQLMSLTATNSAFKSVMGIQVGVVMAGVPPMPVVLQGALGPHLAALRQHADDFDKLIKIVTDIVDKS